MDEETRRSNVSARPAAVRAVSAELRTEAARLCPLAVGLIQWTRDGWPYRQLPYLATANRSRRQPTGGTRAHHQHLSDP